MKIDKDILGEFCWHETKNQEGDWLQAAYVYQNETRWGVIHQIVLLHIPTNTYWAFYMETSSGDGEYSSLDDCGKEVELSQVYPHEVTTVEYRAA